MYIGGHIRGYNYNVSHPLFEVNFKIQQHVFNQLEEIFFQGIFEYYWVYRKIITI